MEYNDYMNMPFCDLFSIVFTPDGEVKVCGREACQAMIKRLEAIYGDTGAYGDKETGKLNLPYAYKAAKNAI